MNPLARMWAKRELDRLQRAEIRHLARKIRKQYDEIEPMRREAEARRRERMRQDGDAGFVMVQD